MTATMLQGERFLNSVNLKTIIETLASDLERRRPLVYDDWISDVDAEDDEIIGRFTGHVYAADLIVDDQKAVVYESGKVELSTNQIVNLKIGQKIDQAKLNMMERLKNSSNVREENALERWEEMMAENLLFGIRQRRNALKCAMMLDSLNYDRLGVKLSGAAWGMPSDLKVTPSTLWTNASDADPITDIQTLNNYAGDTYGINYDTMFIRPDDLDLMSSCTKFWQRVTKEFSVYFGGSPTFANTIDRDSVKGLLGKILNMDVILDLATYNEMTGEGKRVSRRYLPQGKIILGRKEDRKNPQVWDFANGVVTESVAASLMGGGGTFNISQHGPTGYYTGPPDLNPPHVIAWAVARGFPRKHVLECNAVLTVR